VGRSQKYPDVFQAQLQTWAQAQRAAWCWIHRRAIQLRKKVETGITFTLFFCLFSNRCLFVEVPFKGDLHGIDIFDEDKNYSSSFVKKKTLFFSFSFSVVAILAVHGIGQPSCRIIVSTDGVAVLKTSWSSLGPEEQTWSEPQVAQTKVPIDAVGGVLLLVEIQGKMSRKTKYGEVRLPFAESMQKTTAPIWLDIEATEKGAMTGSQRVKMQAVQHFPPQIQVKLLFVPKTLGASAALFLSRRKKLLELPLPEKLLETVKEMSVPRKPLPAAPSEDKSPHTRGRKGSVLLSGEVKEALVALSRDAAATPKSDDDDGDGPAGQNYMAINDSAIESAKAASDDDESGDGEGAVDMYKAVDHEQLAKNTPPLPTKKGPPKKAMPAFARIEQEEANGNGYKAIDNSTLEEEMDHVIQEHLPVKMRGRGSSVMTRVIREKDEWRDMDSFNARFQEAVETMNMHGAQSNTRRKELIESCLTVIRLAQDFVSLASQYGKTIISEHALPESKRTIKPRKDLGGVLGGEKFIVLGILFKFATDEKKLFKSLSDPLEAANKIAGLELKGLKVKQKQKKGKFLKNKKNTVLF
jgi:hypothetical protein